jgi:hypothetical protein
MPQSALKTANSDERTVERLVVAIAAGLRSANGRRVPVMLRNLSSDGFMCEGGSSVAPGCLVTLDLFDGRSFEGRIVWKRSGHVGGAFITPVDEAVLVTIA